MKKNGYTLVEILVGVVIGVISVAAAFSAYNYYTKSYDSVSQKAQVNKTAREGLSIILKDLRNAGYIDPTFISGGNNDRVNSQREAELNLIGVSQKNRAYYGKYQQADFLSLTYTISSRDRYRVQYFLWKYRNENNYYLARDVVRNAYGGRNFNHISNKELIVPYVEDFQVILKDKDGNILTPACMTCGPEEQKQGSGALENTPVGQKTKGQANQKLVHTADVYLTVRSPKEVYKTTRRIQIKNGEPGHGSNFTISPGDRYHRETFFASAHTRNLAIPQIRLNTGSGSISQGQGYNK